MIKKKTLIMIITIILLLGVLGVSYAFWRYSKVGPNQMLVSGNIYMKYTGNNTIKIDNAMPKDYATADDKYFEFTIEGTNTSSKDIWYEILISEGDTPDESTGKTIRLKPDLLLFKLVEVNGEDEEIIFDRMSYPDLNNKSIWVDKINSQSNDEIKRTYRLYMWVSPLTSIGLESDSEEELVYDYDYNTWTNNVFASIKVIVKGDFSKKVAYSCFTGVESANYNKDRTEEQVSACTEIFSKPDFVGWFSGSETPRAFCDGTGTSNGATLDQDASNSSTFAGYKDKLIEIGILIANPVDNSLIGGYKDECSKKMVIPTYMNKNKITTLGSNAFRGKNLVSVNIPDTVEEIGTRTFSENNLTKVKIPDSVTTINSFAFFHNNLERVNIPSKVTTIEEAVFNENKLTSIDIPDNIVEIGKEAFLGNRLTSVFVPNSVKVIGEQAFAANDLEEVIVGNGITYIDDAAFGKNRLIVGSSFRNQNLKSVRFDKTCEELKNIEASSSNTNKYFPWLGGEEEYRKGTTIYGKDNELCSKYE